MNQEDIQLRWSIVIEKNPSMRLKCSKFFFFADKKIKCLEYTSQEQPRDSSRLFPQAQQVLHLYRASTIVQAQHGSI